MGTVQLNNNEFNDSGKQVVYSDILFQSLKENFNLSEPT